MTETERKLLLHLATWLIKYADPVGEGALEAQHLINRIIVSEKEQSPNKSDST
jgi:hypothetical protein